MTNQTFNFNAFVDASRKAFAPAARFQELTLKGFERVARQQLAFAGEMLEFSMQQIQLTTTARDFNDLTARQADLATQFAEKATQRSQDLVKLTSEHQAEISKLFDKTVAETVQTAKKAA
ncbi:MAG: phasin family protein [Steroidobacteraceae bacterium]